MAQLNKKMGRIYTYLFDELADSRTSHFPMMSSPLPVIVIAACYVYFVMKLGPRLMKNRPPFQIDRLVQVYDVIQVGLSLWTTYECLTLCWFFKYNFFCEPINYSYDPIPLRIARLGYVAYLIKLFDFVDTIIFVLRKKYNQITFLHVYHHVMMAAAYWFGVKYVADPRVYDLPLMSSPYRMLVITACYVYFVKRLGPRLMENRRPFQLDRIVQVYNVVQVIISVYIAYWCLVLGWLSKYKWICEPINYSYDEEPVQITRTCYLYFLVKIFDFTDTVFFVLRKKNNQISVLHVYHHVLMTLGMWYAVKYFAGGHGSLVGLVNSVVHAVMYSYYLMTSLYPESKKNMWWKKHITQLQMAQFLILTIHNGLVFVVPVCNYPKYTTMLFIPQGIIMFLLFSNFYVKTYCNQKTGNQKTGHVKEESNIKKLN